MFRSIAFSSVMVSIGVATALVPLAPERQFIIAATISNFFFWALLGTLCDAPGSASRPPVD